MVLKEFGRRGIAQEIIKATVKYIKSNFQENEIVLSSQLYAKALYESVGFIAILDIYEEGGIPDIKMYKIFN